MNLFRVILLFFLLSSAAFASDTTSVKQRKFAIGFTVSPDYCYRRLSIIGPNQNAQYIIDYRNGLEGPMIGYTGGICLFFPVKKQIGVSAGLCFSQKGFSGRDALFYDANGMNLIRGDFRDQFNYLQVPLKMALITGEKKVRFVSEIGLTPSFLLYENSFVHLENSSSYKTKPNYINDVFNLFVDVSAGVDLRLGKKLNLRFEPTCSYGILYTVPETVTEHLYSAGLNIGLYFQL